MTTYAEYVKFLRFGADREAEFHDLASVLSNNETYFFRERAQLRALCGSILTELQSTSPRIRVWSAACSTGEEPYSLAMSLLETGRVAESNISIKATDISPRVLELCHRGYYRALSFRATEPAMVQKYFTVSGDGFVINDRVKRLVEFSSLNLMDDRRVAGNGPFDAIFCRNVLIYFDKPTQKRVVESFARALRPGGYLFLGHAESLFALTDVYEPVIQPESIVYRLRAPVPGGAR
jgi:chemotaxis protein methyltransferase CheR